MALYAISDLHLPIGVDKPMDIFGSKWDNYVSRLKENWERIVTDKDTVVINGDISWAMYLDEAIPDFSFIDSLPGKKIISKGNHDYWWTTMSKLKKFALENEFTTIDFMQNNTFIYNNTAICGTRGWSYLGNGDASEDDKKIYERELGRLELSINDAKRYNPENIIVFFHYPPINIDLKETGFTRIMKGHNIERCIYGHLHNALRQNIVEGEHDGIKYMLVSCDYRGFTPVKLCD